MLKKYYKFIDNLNYLYLDSINNFTNKKSKIKNIIKPFEINFKLKIDEKFLNSKVFKITEDIYMMIINCLYEIIFKVSWLKNEYANEIENLKFKIEELEMIKNDLKKYKNDLLDNIINSNLLKHSNQKLISYSFDYIENFNIQNEYIVPIFYNIKKLDYQLEKHSNKKIVLNLNKTKFVSKINFLFNINIEDEIIIMYKSNNNTKIEYTTDKIKLSKNKSISLKFNDCSQIIIFSNSNFVDFLNNIEIFGGSEEVNDIQIKAIINLPEDTKQIMIDTSEDFYFYEFKENEEINNLKQINNNLINNISTNKLIMISNTNKSVLNKFNIYKKD